MARSTDKTYNEVKTILKSELPPDMMSWDEPQFKRVFRKMMYELTIINGVRNRNPVRTFNRWYLSVRGDDHSFLRDWLRNIRGLREDFFLKIVRITAEWKNGSLKRVDIPTRGTAIQNTDPDAEIQIPLESISGVGRKVIDHTISLLNSLSGLIVEAQVTSSSVFDGDRMQIQAALEPICKSLGIEVTFKEWETEHSTPLTRRELSGFGKRIRGGSNRT